MRFFFKETDTRVFASLRIGISICAFFSCAALMSSVNLHLSDDGWLPHRVASVLNRQDIWSATSIFDSPGGTYLLLTATMLSAIVFGLGFKTKFSNFLMFAGLSLIRSKNPIIEYGGDDVIRILALYLLLTPSGSRWSIDYRQARRPRRTSPIWSLRVIQIQICCIYAVAGFTKLLGDDWPSGTALLITLQDPVFARYPFLLSFQFPHFFVMIVNGVTVLIPFIEAVFPLLMLFKISRVPILVLFIILHLSIALLLKTELFSYAMIVSLFAFMPETIFDAFEGYFMAARRRR